MDNIHLTEKERKLALLLIRYMQKNPEAKHTAEGIARWWIMQEKFENQIELLQNVLDYFVNIDLIKKVSIPNGENLYKLNFEKFNKIIHTLEEFSR